MKVKQYASYFLHLYIPYIEEGSLPKTVLTLFKDAIVSTECFDFEYNL